MKKYTKRLDGSYEIDGKVIPESERNKDFRKMLKEVDEGKAELIELTTPSKSDLKKEDDKAEALAYLRSTNEIVLYCLEDGKPVPKDIAKKRTDAKKLIGE
jgi:hypothetical protein